MARRSRTRGPGRHRGRADLRPASRARARPRAAPATAHDPRRRRPSALGRLGVDRMAVLPFTPPLAAQTAPEEFARGRPQRRAPGDDGGGRGRLPLRARARGRRAPCLRPGAQLGLPGARPAPRSSSRERRSAAAACARPWRAATSRGRGAAGPSVLPSTAPSCAAPGRGRTIGIPTANIAPVNETLPRHGVYACWCGGRGGAPTGPRSSTSDGGRPSAGRRRTVEAHLLDVDGRTSTTGRPGWPSVPPARRADLSGPGRAGRADPRRTSPGAVTALRAAGIPDAI